MRGKMLQREGKTPKRVIEYGFLVGVEMEEDVKVDNIVNHLEGSLTWVEGCGKVEITPLGNISEGENDEKDS